MLEQFTISDTNPNAEQGSGGCLCHPDTETYCEGPYVVFHAAYTDSPYSPHCVVGCGCLKSAATALDRHVAGEPAPAIDTTAVEESEADGPPV